ncbi:four-carbon acid sugar kinase family protein [Paraburkholderia fungorum]
MNPSTCPGLPTTLAGCSADDFTGATDVANMLVRGGMRTF